jgi:hypothetical protein
MLTLLKQARPSGWLRARDKNPVDLDYKGLSNCGTWFIGRLQTERDKLRVIEGLKSALAGGEDGAGLEALMSSLTQRVFLMRNVHDDAPVLMKTRWALSYLRGPLTGPEIARVMEARKKATTTAAPAAVDRTAAALPATRRDPDPGGRRNPRIFSCRQSRHRCPALQTNDRGLLEAALRRRQTGSR